MIANNPKNFGDIDVTHPPVPTIFDKNDDSTENLRDPSVDRDVESQFDLSFYYPSNDTPTETTAGFESNEAFLRAVLTGNTPTMYVYGKNFVSDINLNLEKVFPTVFPFGVGGPGVNRENNVSYEECLRHYQDLCLSNFHKDDFILVSNHLLNRMISFKYAIIRCQKKVSPDLTLAQQFSNIKVKDLEEAWEQRQRRDTQTSFVSNSTSQRYFQTVSACCRPLQHTAEAATAARGKYFALYDRFDSGAIFVTVTPAGSRNLRVKAFILAQGVDIPKPWEMSDSNCKELLDELVELNQMYPGAGALEFRSQLDLFIEDIMKWDRKKQKSKGISIFGVVQGFGITVEDQKTGNLHAHGIVFIEGTTFFRGLNF
jgi:hypothetical protein